MNLPLFPLNTVLFPGAELPLHIFEPRYRQMIGRCIDQESPFGVVLIRSGPEVGGMAEPRRVGVTARITTVERLPDGRMNIVGIGQDRFRILDTSTDLPYLTGDVELLSDYDADSDAAQTEAERVRALFLRFTQLTMVPRGEWTRRVPTPRRLGVLADYLAARLPADTDVKQDLLEELSVPRRLSGVARILEDVIAMLEPRIAAIHRRRVTDLATLN
jgi:Lon protease-like protein